MNNAIIDIYASEGDIDILFSIRKLLIIWINQKMLLIC